MRTYELHRDDGYFLAFEIENVYVRPKKIGEILSTVDGVTDVKVRRPFGASSDVHVAFEYLGIDYIVWEPFGDNSRYWIGPEQEQEQPSDIDIAPLANAFGTSRTPATAVNTKRAARKARAKAKIALFLQSLANRRVVLIPTHRLRRWLTDGAA